jgi:hypothetical protein
MGKKTRSGAGFWCVIKNGLFAKNISQGKLGLPNIEY